MFISAVSNIRHKFNNNNDAVNNQSNNNSQVVQKIRRIVTGSRHNTSQMNEMLGHVTRTLITSSTEEERWVECSELLERRLTKKRKVKTCFADNNNNSDVYTDDEQSISC